MQTRNSLESMFTEPRSAMSDGDKIRRWVELDKQMKALADERRIISSELIEIAAGQQNGQTIVHLQASDGSKVDVEFAKVWKVNQEEIEVAKELLKDEKFSEIFKTEYTPRLRAMRLFLNTVFDDEAWETAKAIVKEYVVEVDKPAYVSAPKLKR